LQNVWIKSTISVDLRRNPVQNLRIIHTVPQLQGADDIHETLMLDSRFQILEMCTKDPGFRRAQVYGLYGTSLPSTGTPSNSRIVQLQVAAGKW
jgi:hypothetical protein